MKTVRFATLVADCGQPEPYTLWMAPEEDAAFQAALKDSRILTLHQEYTGSKKDYGEVGYLASSQASYLVFPKSLRAYAGAKVIGVKYENLATVPAKPTKRAAKATPQQKSAKRKVSPQPLAQPPSPQRPEAKRPVPALKPRRSSVKQQLEALQREALQALTALKAGNPAAAQEILAGALRG